MGEWWNDTLEAFGDVSKEFDADIRPCFEGAAVDGKMTPEAFFSQWEKVKEWRIKFNHDIHPLSIDQVSKFMKEFEAEDPMDVQTALQLAWTLVNEG